MTPNLRQAAINRAAQTICDTAAHICQIPSYFLVPRTVMDELYAAYSLPEDPPQPLDAKQRERPKIVCLCGSTRFGDAFREANLRETLAGKIVLSIGCDFKSDQGLGLTEEDKVRLDDLHKRKIDLADEVLILNVSGYIGKSTQSELDYADAHGKVIRFLEPTPAPEQPAQAAAYPVCDGHGSMWQPCPKHNCTMEVMRPGDARCPKCEEEAHGEITQDRTVAPLPESPLTVADLKDTGGTFEYYSFDDGWEIRFVKPGGAIAERPNTCMDSVYTTNVRKVRRASPKPETVTLPRNVATEIAVVLENRGYVLFAEQLRAALK